MTVTLSAVVLLPGTPIFILSIIDRRPTIDSRYTLVLHATLSGPPSRRRAIDGQGYHPTIITLRYNTLIRITHAQFVRTTSGHFAYIRRRSRRIVHFRQQTIIFQIRILFVDFVVLLPWHFHNLIGIGWTVDLFDWGTFEVFAQLRV